MTAPPSLPTPYLDAPLARDWHARLGALVLKLMGWRVVLAQPVPARCVIVIYPHTSNWDFPIGLAAKWYMAIHVRFIGKDTLFRWPLAGAMVRWGGIPVDRRAPHGVIGQLAERFAREPDFRLVLAPEGTRSRTGHWRSGFYHLTRAAGVPLGLAFIDYAKREVGVGGYLELTGDETADMARIASFYAGIRGKRPENASPVRLTSGP